MLTQTQIDFFHTNGYLIMRGLIKGEELERLRQAADRVQNSGLLEQDADHLYRKNPDGSRTYFRSEKIWQRDPIFQAVTVNPDLLENVGQCIGEQFYPWNDSLVVKVVREGEAFDWHQDPPYMKPGRTTTFAVPNFTTDIYLDRSTQENGCLWAISGHHLVGHVDLAKDQQALFNEYGAEPLEMEPGDVIFHSVSTPHGSHANFSDQQRRTFYVHFLSEAIYQDAYAYNNNQKKPGWGEKRQELVENMLQERTQAGLEATLARGTLQLGEGGFEFVGSVKTPPAYWSTLAAAMTPQEKEALRQLERVGQLV